MKRIQGQRGPAYFSLNGPIYLVYIEVGAVAFTIRRSMKGMQRKREERQRQRAQ